MGADYNSPMRFALLAAMTLFASTGVAAHEKFKIVGTIAVVHAGQLDVKSVDGSTYEMDFPDAAAVFQNNRKVGRAALKPGAKVTVNAIGHDFFDLEVVEVHITDQGDGSAWLHALAGSLQEQ